MTCAPEARDTVRRAARALAGLPAVEAVDTLPPTKGQLDAWTLEAIVEYPNGVPPGVHREIALAGLSTRPQPTRGDCYRVLATA